MYRELTCRIFFALAIGFLADASAGIPDGWSNLDIGTTGGGADEADGTWTVRGDGADIWSGADEFHFACLLVSGDCEITARVVDNGVGSNTWAKGGVMIRETLTPGSKNAMMAITGGNGGGMAFQNRPTTHGRPYSAHSNPTASPPHWVRLRREGDTITAYSSPDGVDWVQQPDGTAADSTANPVVIPMAEAVYVGLAVTSHAAGEVRTYTFDNVTVGGPVNAGAPEPADGAVHPDAWAVLSWLAGSTADSHDIYFGTSFADVSNGSSEAFQGNQRESAFTVGLPTSAYPDGLVRGATYYWRVDEVESDGVTRHEGSVWRFVVGSEKAWAPFPSDGAHFVATSLTLTWTPGLGAERHTVYFGDDFETVANSAAGNVVMRSEYNRRNLESGKTYYWRVDESKGRTTHRGDVWSFTTLPADLVGTTFYYVDADHPDARDGNPGTETLPWKTIRKGTQSLQAGDVLLIKAGTYRETVILARSGTEAKPMRIWAYPGDEGQAIINAAEPVTGWQRCAGPGDCAGNPDWEHIYVADVAALVQSHPDSSFAIRQVFQDGELLKRSRYPEVGWRYPSWISDPKKIFTDSSLSKPDGYFIGSVCHIKTAMWRIDQIPITGFYRGSVTLAKNPWFDISTHFGYYITSIVGEINEEGEWAYDPAGKKLFLWPRGEEPRGVEFTYRDYCVRTYGGTGWNIVRGLAMRNAYRDGIWLYRANNMTIEDNTIEHAFNYGIHLQSTGGTCNDNQILRNTIRYSGYRGMNVGEQAHRCNVEGNYVYATGVEHYGEDLMNGPSEGVYIVGPSARIYNNRIDRVGNVGLYLHGEALGRDASYNHITNTGLALSDTGGIYTAGVCEGPAEDHIHHNIIEDSLGCQTMDRNHDRGLPVTIEKYAGDSSGIYVDEQGNNRIIEHNTVINSHKAGIYFHWAPGNVVRNNTLYGNRKAQLWFSGRNQPGDRLVDDVVLDNIMFATHAQQKTFFLGINYDDVHFGQSDRNYFYNPHRYWHIFVNRYSGEWINEDLTLQRWRALSGYDADSREFRYLDQFSGIAIVHPAKSRIVYNATLSPVNIDLEGDTYCDVEGNKIYGVVTLEPFESKVLISCDFAVPDPSLAGEEHARR